MPRKKKSSFPKSFEQKQKEKQKRKDQKRRKRLNQLNYAEHVHRKKLLKDTLALRPHVKKHSKHKEYRDAAATLIEIRKLEAQEMSPNDRLRDMTRSERSQYLRRAVVERLNYMCPRCKKPKLKLSQWVIRRENKTRLALCRGCNKVLSPNHKKGRPRKIRREEARLAILPADRICPVCGELVLESRRWVDEPASIMCLKCYRRK